MIEINVVNESVWCVDVHEDIVTITFAVEGDIGSGPGHELKLGRSLVTRICELMPNELIEEYVKARQEAEKREARAIEVKREALRHVLKLQGELESCRVEGLQLEI